MSSVAEIKEGQSGGDFLTHSPVQELKWSGMAPYLREGRLSTISRLESALALRSLRGRLALCLPRCTLSLLQQHNTMETTATRCISVHRGLQEVSVKSFIWVLN